MNSSSIKSISKLVEEDKLVVYSPYLDIDNNISDTNKDLNEKCFSILLAFVKLDLDRDISDIKELSVRLKNAITTCQSYEEVKLISKLIEDVKSKGGMALICCDKMQLRLTEDVWKSLSNLITNEKQDINEKKNDNVIVNKEENKLRDYISDDNKDLEEVKSEGTNNQNIEKIEEKTINVVGDLIQQEVDKRKKAQEQFINSGIEVGSAQSKFKVDEKEENLIVKKAQEQFVNSGIEVGSAQSAFIQEEIEDNIEVEKIEKPINRNPDYLTKTTVEGLTEEDIMEVIKSKISKISRVEENLYKEEDEVIIVLKMYSELLEEMHNVRDSVANEKILIGMRQIEDRLLDIKKYRFFLESYHEEIKRVNQMLEYFAGDEDEIIRAQRKIRDLEDRLFETKNSMSNSSFMKFRIELEEYEQIIKKKIISLEENRHFR